MSSLLIRGSVNTLVRSYFESVTEKRTLDEKVSGMLSANPADAASETMHDLFCYIFGEENFQTNIVTQAHLSYKANPNNRVDDLACILYAVQFTSPKLIGSAIGLKAAKKAEYWTYLMQELKDSLIERLTLPIANTAAMNLHRIASILSKIEFRSDPIDKDSGDLEIGAANLLAPYEKNAIEGKKNHLISVTIASALALNPSSEIQNRLNLLAENTNTYLTYSVA